MFLLLLTGFVGGVGSMWLLGSQPRGTIERLFSSRAEADPTATLQAETEALLDEIWSLLRREYYDPDVLDNDNIKYGAAAGLVGAVGDPNTMFVEPMRAAIMSEDMQGAFEGIGATVQMIDGRLVIYEPLPNSPAEQVGLQVGDVIIEVDGKPIAGKTLAEAISLIRGPAGTVVRLLVEREGVEQPFVVPVTRAKVESPFIEWRMLDGGIAYLRLAEFNALAEERVRQGLKELLAQDPAGLVLDLRDNPGGFLTAAVDIAGEFLPKGALVTIERWRDGTEKRYAVTKRGVAQAIPLVVMINSGSASASEIVAGALRDQERALLIGEQTYGKGSVQNIHELQDGSSLRVTVAKFILPGGESPNGNPIQPDIAVSAEPGEPGDDPQLARAVQVLLTGERVSKVETWPEGKKTQPRPLVAATG